MASPLVVLHLTSAHLRGVHLPWGDVLTTAAAKAFHLSLPAFLPLLFLPFTQAIESIERSSSEMSSSERLHFTSKTYSNVHFNCLLSAFSPQFSPTSFLFFKTKNSKLSHLDELGGLTVWANG